MEKPIFYCDCDGVILNTIEVAFEIMREKGCDLSNRYEVNHYFRHVISWIDIFERSKIINDSVNQLRYLKEKKLFEDVVILTKLSGADHEERLKRDLFKVILPEIKVITLDYGLSKALVVKAKNNILLDDEVGNCRKWEKEDGVAILFSPYMSNVDNNVVSRISDVVNTDGVKRLLKTRNF